jgi:lipopolysaccharide biosynthesis protein
MKILALHLPQFHETSENNEWWGEGFTEWTNVKSAKKLFKTHNQPMAPLNNNYYNLLKKENLKWQADLANEYGLSGFVYFHYWFKGRKILEKPCEILLASQDIKTEYCFCWANHNWTRAWDGKERQMLIRQVYGGIEDWGKHLEYLLPFFKDTRYIKYNNKPVLFIYNASHILNYNEMIEYWDEKLRDGGFDGIYIVEYINSKNTQKVGINTQAVYEDEPLCSARFFIPSYMKLKRFLVKKLSMTDYIEFDLLWKSILKKKKTYGDAKIIQGAFPAWDNSPRRGKKSLIITGSSPEKFEHYFKQLLNSKRKNISNDYLVINSWNEWGEGTYLEPSEALGFAYLEAVKESLISKKMETSFSNV